MKPIHTFALVGFASGLTGAACMWFALRLANPPPVLLSVRVADVIAHQIEQQAKDLNDDSARAVAADRFSRALDAELDTLASKYGAVVFANGAVVRGAEDVTAALEQAVNARLSQASTKPGSP